MGMDLKDVGERFLVRGGALRGDGQRLAEIGAALQSLERMAGGFPVGSMPGRRLCPNLIEEVEHFWPAVRALLTERLLQEATDLMARHPGAPWADGMTEV